ncbi:17.5 kDa class I heat shock protein-like [Prosopis cineraria]|uniref:17.5 kDa class I heat shock protein-like n=1 Tax=Prosopis cineraria TaxID=364024 RepID=UPI0024107184|nr:17.5 kDa class I heat shock protein-like [Prosopis cineraria]
MSLVPINSNSSSSLWDPMDRLLSDMPFPFSWAVSGHDFDLGFGWRVNSRLDWRESSGGHVLEVVLPRFADEDVLVELQDDRMLQVSLESGNFMSRFKIPEDADLQQLKASMNHGVLRVTVPKLQSARPNVRVLEIEGGD